MNKIGLVLVLIFILIISCKKHIILKSTNYKVFLDNQIAVAKVYKYNNNEYLISFQNELNSNKGNNIYYLYLKEKILMPAYTEKYRIINNVLEIDSDARETYVLKEMKFDLENTDDYIKIRMTGDLISEYPPGKDKKFEFYNIFNKDLIVYKY